MSLTTISRCPFVDGRPKEIEFALREVLVDTKRRVDIRVPGKSKCTQPDYGYGGKVSVAPPACDLVVNFQTACKDVPAWQCRM